MLTSSPARVRGHSVYASFFDELEQRIKQGEDPQCFARDMSVMADKHGFSSAQKYFCGEVSCTPLLMSFVVAES